jgi:hypothetical protein
MKMLAANLIERGSVVFAPGCSALSSWFYSL